MSSSPACRHYLDPCLPNLDGAFVVMTNGVLARFAFGRCVCFSCDIVLECIRTRDPVLVVSTNSAGAELHAAPSPAALPPS